MKLKKFFAGVLAAAMMLTVGATAAFADTPSDNVISVSSTALESNGSFKLTKNYKVEKVLHLLKSSRLSLIMWAMKRRIVRLLLFPM